MAIKNRGRPNSNRSMVQLNLRLTVKAITKLRAIAAENGFISAVGKSKGKPSISAWLENFAKDIE
jgi:hypothetical protein